MTAPNVAVLGAGNTGFAIAAELSHRGLVVTLAELPEFAGVLEPIQAEGAIQLFGTASTGLARIHNITTDLAAALAANDLLVMSIPAYGHAPWARALAPHVRAEHVLTLMPGTFGALEMARILREAGAPSITIAETDTAPYVCRRTQPDGATIWGVVPHMGLGVFPAGDTERVLGLLEPLFPGLRPVSSVLECGLGAMNPVVHPVGVLMNAGRIERSRGEFYFYEEGITPGVVEVIEALDAERLAIGAALGFDLVGVAAGFATAGFGPEGDLWSVINGSRMLTALRAPGALDTRWLSEDVPYGLGIWSAVAGQLGVATPIIDSTIRLGLTVLREPAGRLRRTLADVGLEGLDRDGMLAFAGTGKRP
ncbi:MAG: NAD/NADP octopine/nopaline dehydrogenase family protein [Chloroflexota bacterium]|jgi:opine dehydrogenase|nr:NAD/NADP octopine/nopaline dehydrogenase family protein [Chloroflexota bacterium]MDP6757087.1 NAD/NADP octopine/nopaline dehydrogenase family protein [Chloroflexota bacterium]